MEFLDLKKYTCIFPRLYNYNLTKDVGMIPYMLSNKYNTSIVTYDNDEYPYMNEQLNSKNFNIDFITNTGSEKRDVLQYLKNNAKKIDILQLYHLKYNLLMHYIFNYKLRNKNGKIYLKLDANNEIIDFLIKRKGVMPSLRRVYTKIIFNQIDLISIETKRNYELLKGFVNENKLLYIPNGITRSNVSLDNKENIILYVGYVEKKNKSINLLIDAFVDSNIDDWKLVLVGKVEDDMTDYLENLFKNNPQLKDKIILKGYVSDKNLLAEEYAKASIYCCTSKSESFGISTLEAAYHGNYIISTDVGGSLDIINITHYGKIVEHDKNALKDVLTYTTDNWSDIKENAYCLQKEVYDNFSWEIIAKKIMEKID